MTPEKEKIVREIEMDTLGKIDLAMKNGTRTNWRKIVRIRSICEIHRRAVIKVIFEEKGETKCIR